VRVNTLTPCVHSPPHHRLLSLVIRDLEKARP
jgi:hypothetical protein